MTGELGLALLLTWAPLAHPFQVVEYGLVDSVAARPAGWVHRATGDSVALALLLPIYGGDSIVVGAATGVVRIRNHQGSSVWICGTARPRSDCAPPRIPSRIDRTKTGVFSAAITAFAGPVFDLFRRGRWERQVGTYVRGDGEPMAIPLLDPLPAIAAGERVPELTWVGGSAPFTLRLVRIDRRSEIARLEGLRDRAASLHPVNLDPGEWLIELVDAAGRTLQRTFRVVPPGQVPAPGADQLRGWTGSARTMLSAVRLAQQDDGRWAWEAYLRLGSLASSDSTAAKVRRELAAGRIP